MESLKVEFEGKGDVSGIKFIQVNKSDRAFIYERTDNAGHKAYEVFERRLQKEARVNYTGQIVTYGERELYPKTKHFGIWAWCFIDYQRALDKFEELNENVRRARSQNKSQGHGQIR